MMIIIHNHNNYESQPKAWAEYRYKRSELGGVGGGGSDLGPFGKVRPEPGWGELQKCRAALPFCGA